jgi:hypothetical protein
MYWLTLWRRIGRACIISFYVRLKIYWCYYIHLSSGIAMLPYSYSNCNKSHHVPGFYQYTLLKNILAPWVSIFEEFLDALIYYANSPQKPGATPWLLNIYMCHVLFSSILTHATTLMLMADMNWWKVIAIVSYGGTMISDHDTGSHPRVSYGLLPSGDTGYSLLTRSMIMIHYSRKSTCFRIPWKFFWVVHVPWIP